MKMFVQAVALVLGTSALAAGPAACRSTQSASAQIDDASIKAAVKSKLARDVRFSTLTNIEVNSTNGIVTLAGKVHNSDERRAAAKIASLVSAVKRVNNELQVELSSTN